MNAKRPCKDRPNPDVRLIYLQTFFPFPHIRWFAVGDENDGAPHTDGVARTENGNETFIVIDPVEDATARDTADKKPDGFWLARRKATKDGY